MRTVSKSKKNNADFESERIKERSIKDICRYRLVFNKKTRKFEKVIHYKSTEVTEKVEN